MKLANMQIKAASLKNRGATVSTVAAAARKATEHPLRVTLHQHGAGDSPGFSRMASERTIASSLSLS